MACLELPSHTVMKMPALSPTMTQGNIGEWKKQPGDAVNPGDVLVDIETDKAQMELECQEEGILAKILLPEGTKEAPVGKPLAIIVTKKEDVDRFKNYKVEEAPSVEASSVETPSVKAPSVEAPSVEAPPSTAVQVSPPGSATHVSTDGRIFASPLARSTAKSMNVDLSNITGTGPRGRVVKADIIASSSVTSQSTPTESSSHIDIPLSNMRKVIAQRLTDSKQSIPHYYLTVDVNMENVIKLRSRYNQRGSGGEFKLSVNDFIIKAAACAMSDVPQVNSAWHGTFIRQYKTADISVAVATESGLITPIIAKADLKGLVAISREMRELAGKARENKLRPEQFQGGSFTISNLGMFGIKHFTAIINPPQACILAVGGTERRFIPDESGNPVPASVMTVTMSCDHRAVDGATGAQWLQYFKKYMEDPVTMLL